MAAGAACSGLPLFTNQANIHLTLPLGGRAASVIRQTLASWATLQISRWALAGVSPRFPSETNA